MSLYHPLRAVLTALIIADDVLKYVGPSLEEYKGCDILDLNPGAGLWSSKLHDYLKPRSHVLLESEPEKFGSFLEPLLSKPGTTYKLIKGECAFFDTLRDLMKDGTFPYQKPSFPGETHSQEPNKSLLVTGTFAWDPKLPGIGFDSLSKQLMVQYTTMAWSNDIFHVFGPARMLFWTMSEDAWALIPRSMLHVGKSSFFVHKTGDAKQIVGPEHADRGAGRGTIGRDPRYELESIAKVLKSSKENGMELPAHRRENAHDFAEDILKRTNGRGIISAAECTQYLREQEQSGKSTVGLAVSSAIDLWQHEKAQAGEDYNQRERWRG